MNNCIFRYTNLLYAWSSTWNLRSVCQCTWKCEILLDELPQYKVVNKAKYHDIFKLFTAVEEGLIMQNGCLQGCSVKILRGNSSNLADGTRVTICVDSCYLHDLSTEGLYSTQNKLWLENNALF